MLKNIFYCLINWYSNTLGKMHISQYGKNVTISKGTRFYGKGNVTIGNNCNIGPNSFIECVENGKLIIGDDFSNTSKLFISCLQQIKIGNDCLLGNNIRIYDNNHGMNPNESYRKQPMKCKDVVIGDGVWIGDNVIILPGVHVGEKAVIGAGSVVTTDIPAYTISAGNPARVIKTWNNEESKWKKY